MSQTQPTAQAQGLRSRHGRAPASPAWLASWDGLRRAGAASLALPLLLAIGVAAIWAAPRPMMIDLPQHAGQVALLKDMALGRSPWSADIRINLATPYLIGYGLALPLSFVMSVAAALKTVLTLAYLAFVGAGVAIGRELGASRKLDAYHAFSFFGFSYGWGFYTFLVAAPLGLVFLWLSLRYARRGLASQGAAMAGLGLVLLFSHGLVFLFACGLGSLLVLARAPSLRALVLRSWPFWVLVAACATVFFSNPSGSGAGPLLHGNGLGGALRLMAILSNAFGLPGASGLAALWPSICFPVFAGLPLLAGLRPDWRAREAVVIAGGVAAAVALLPDFAWSTAMISQRFAIFLPSAYVWLLRERTPSGGSLAVGLQPRLAGLAALVTAGLLAQHAWSSVQFGREQRDFERVMAAAEPDQRALGLIFDANSAVDRRAGAYLHHALWYQADRRGLVDYNFAQLQPQIARFRAGAVPPMSPFHSQSPRDFDWRTDGGDRYRYIFVRSQGAPPHSAFAGAACAPVQVAASGEWRLYERAICRAR